MNHSQDIDRFVINESGALIHQMEFGLYFCHLPINGVMGFISPESSVLILTNID